MQSEDEKNKSNDPEKQGDQMMKLAEIMKKQPLSRFSQKKFTIKGQSY